MQKEKAKELHDLLSDGGTLIVSVWNLTEKNIPGSEIEIPFENEKGNIFNRYHFVFEEANLVALFSQAGFSSIKCYLENQRNWIVIAKK